MKTNNKRQSTMNQAKANYIFDHYLYGNKSDFINDIAKLSHRDLLECIHILNTQYSGERDGKSIFLIFLNTLQGK